MGFTLPLMLQLERLRWCRLTVGMAVARDAKEGEESDVALTTTGFDSTPSRKALEALASSSSWSLLLTLESLFVLYRSVVDGPIAGSSAYAVEEVGACCAIGDGDIMMRFLPW
ncbi:hypothetical protein LR48_Vigan05g079800 [Vigna angularis]|uniref:Uncharacterized protein n=1 Tax=Phaseolus angularis TaxID=3914 RepID=A0A0L9UKV5_PHAAN|nr:hypothetical protein LR48_Vigan05g079800 [Vigna angularis]